jgi:hypothetical protein
LILAAIAFVGGIGTVCRRFDRLLVALRFLFGSLVASSFHDLFLASGPCQSRHMNRRAIVPLALLSVMVMAPPASASCAPPQPLRDELGDAKVAFVGTVISTTNLERTALVNVEQIWLGRSLPETVEVRGGPVDDGTATSNDRSFDEGERYLFVPMNATPPFRDDACSATQPFTPEVAQLTPEGALDPTRPGSVAWIVVIAALVGAGVWQLRRARRSAQSTAPDV